MATPRERMVRSAALLIRERGAHPTAIAAVLAHSGAPRGSAHHHFPGGRTQRLCEAVDYAGDRVPSKSHRLPTHWPSLDGLFAGYRELLMRTDYRAGCPVVAVAVEAGDPDKPQQSEPVIDRAATAFTPLDRTDRRPYEADGIDAERAAELAMQLLTGIEGGIVVARAARDVGPLDVIRGACSDAFLKALGSYYRSNALAQEKTGEHGVAAHFYGGHIRGEFEHAEVSVFVGKNPWMSQSFPRAPVVLNDTAKDLSRVDDRHRPGHH